MLANSITLTPAPSPLTSMKRPTTSIFKHQCRGRDELRRLSRTGSSSPWPTCRHGSGGSRNDRQLDNRCRGPRRPDILCIIRLVLGPTAADRTVAVDTVNTLTIAAMVILGLIYQEVIFIDVALVYALLSFVSTLYIAKYLGGEL